MCAVDGNPQRSLCRWHADRVEAGHTPTIAAVEKLGNLCSTLNDSNDSNDLNDLNDLNGRYDVVLIDVAGNDSKEMRTAKTTAHRMLVTVRPSQQFKAWGLMQAPIVITDTDEWAGFRPDKSSTLTA